MVPGGLVGLSAAALVLLTATLLAVTLRTARPAPGPLPSHPEYLRRWSDLHGGYDPSSSPFVAGWLRIAYTAARPLARRGVLPDVLTTWGLLVSGVVVLLAALGGRWALLAALVVVLSGLADSLDGTVAVLTGRVTRFGYVLDSVVDRVSDAAYLVALAALGANGRVCVAAGVALGLLEYTRARAGTAGMAEIGVVTVGERGTRITVLACTLLGVGAVPGHAGLLAGLGAGTLLALCVAGLAQLLPVVRRELG